MLALSTAGVADRDAAVEAGQQCVEIHICTGDVVPVHRGDIDICSGQKRREKQIQHGALCAIDLRKSRTSGYTRAIGRARILGICDSKYA